MDFNTSHIQITNNENLKLKLSYHLSLDDARHNGFNECEA